MKPQDQGPEPAVYERELDRLANAEQKPEAKDLEDEKYLIFCRAARHEAGKD